MTTQRSSDWISREWHSPAVDQSTPSLAQLWAIKNLRQAIGMNQASWNNMLRLYRIGSAHELSTESADQIIGLLSSTRQNLEYQDNAASPDQRNAVHHFLSASDSRMQ